MEESTSIIQVSPNWESRQFLLRRVALASAVAAFASLATTLWMYRAAHTASWIAELVTAGLGTSALAAKVENVVETRQMDRLQEGVDRIAKKELGYLHFYNTYPIQLIPNLTEARKNVLRRALFDSGLEIQEEDRKLLGLPDGDFAPEQYLTERQVYAGELSFTEYYRTNRHAARAIDLSKVPGAADDVRARWSYKELTRETAIVTALGIDVDQVLLTDAQRLSAGEFKAKHGEGAESLPVVKEVLKEKVIEAIKQGRGDHIVDAIAFGIDLDTLFEEIHDNLFAEELLSPKGTIIQLLTQWPDLFVATQRGNADYWREQAAEATQEMSISLILRKSPQLFEMGIISGDTPRGGDLTLRDQLVLEAKERNDIEAFVEQYGMHPFQFGLVKPQMVIVQKWVLNYFKAHSDQIYKKNRTELTDQILGHACLPEFKDRIACLEKKAQEAEKARNDALVLAEHHYLGAMNPDQSVVTDAASKEEKILAKMQRNLEKTQQRLDIYKIEATPENIRKFLHFETLAQHPHFRRGATAKRTPKSMADQFKAKLRRKLSHIEDRSDTGLYNEAISIAARIVFELELEVRELEAAIPFEETRSKIRLERLQGPMIIAENLARDRKELEEASANRLLESTLESLRLEIYKWKPIDPTTLDPDCYLDRGRKPAK